MPCSEQLLCKISCTESSSAAGGPSAGPTDAAAQPGLKTPSVPLLAHPAEPTIVHTNVKMKMKHM